VILGLRLQHLFESLRAKLEQRLEAMKWNSRSHTGSSHKNLCTPQFFYPVQRETYNIGVLIAHVTLTVCEGLDIGDGHRPIPAIRELVQSTHRPAGAASVSVKSGGVSLV